MRAAGWTGCSTAATTRSPHTASRHEPWFCSVELPPTGGGRLSACPRRGPLVSRDLLDAALSLVLTLAQAIVGGADGVSLTLARHGRLTTVAESAGEVREFANRTTGDTVGVGSCAA